MTIFINPVGMSRQKMLDTYARRLNPGDKVSKDEVIIRQRIGTFESVAIVKAATEQEDDVVYWAMPKSSLNESTAGMTNEEVLSAL